MDSWKWILIALFATIIYLVCRLYGLWVLETTTSWVLATYTPGVLSQGKQVSGPKWKFPNGSLLQRFLDGRTCSERWQSYGPVYRIWSGLRPEIVITTPQDYKHFSSDAGNHGKPRNMNLGWFVGQVLGQCLGFQNGEDWVRVKAMFNPPFTHSAAVARISMVNSAAESYVKQLPKLAVTSDKSVANSFTVSVEEAFTKFPYFVTAKVIYGTMTKSEEDDLWHLTEKRIALNPYLFGGGPYRSAIASRIFDRDAVSELTAFNSEWQKYNAQMAQKRRTWREKPPIVTYWEEYEKGNMTLAELLQTVDEFLMLNLDVISHVLISLITLVAGHDNVKRELCDEIAANGDRLEQYIASTDTHLHRCLAESMRIRPFTIFTLGEYSNEVKNFHGVLVKPGTQILLDIHAINVRNPFWGANSEDFDPSRLKHIKPSDLRYNLHSFGIGSRRCIGQYVASHIAKALLLHLHLEYEVVMLDSKQKGDGAHGVDKTSWTPKENATLHLTKKRGT
ncbi:cytochrome P450 monooxygenase GliC2 [Nemania serpens]|nr:cytochrome P450 monooxygenase GliC2 [Nemania serpens]